MKLPRTISICDRDFRVVLKRWRRMIRPGTKDVFGEADWNTALITVHHYQGMSWDEIEDTLWHESLEMWLESSGCRRGDDTEKRTFRMTHDDLTRLAGFCRAMHKSINEAEAK